MSDTETFTSTMTGETFKINHHLDCDDRCIIYLLTCKQCQEQYTGETADDFLVKETGAAYRNNL